jgi:alkaline phosphatase D
MFQVIKRIARSLSRLPQPRRHGPAAVRSSARPSSDLARFQEATMTISAGARRLIDRKVHGLTRRGAVLAGTAALALPAGLTVAPATAPLPAADRALQRIAFGSCCKQTKSQPIWDAIGAQRPDLFLFLGDNVYLDIKLGGDVVADGTDPIEVRQAYALLAKRPQFAAFRRAVPILATWDDHDYGLDDAGAEFPAKAATREIFCDFFGVPADSARRTRPDGLYDAMSFGPVGRRVQVILLDLRWNRTPLEAVGDAEAALRDSMSMGPYVPTDDPAATILGAAQWAWLEARLREPADLRLIGTSLPFVMEGTGWEVWANYPAEKRRMVELIASTRANGVVFVSGDTHWAEHSRLSDGAPYPLWDVTSSGLTEEWDQIAVNPYRVGPFTWKRNFGLLTIEWDAGTVLSEIRNEAGRPALVQTIPFARLRV